MKHLGRRGFLRTACAAPLLGQAGAFSSGSPGSSASSRSLGSPGSGGALGSPRPTDIRVESVSTHYQEYVLRTPFEFGGRVVRKSTVLTVDCAVRTVDGRAGRGSGSMLLGNVWSFPSATMSYETTLGAMQALAERLGKATAAYGEAGHPIDINRALEPAYLGAAAGVSKELRLAEPIPKLCVLVTASAFDAAVHDAFGKVHGLNSYRTCGPDFMSHDLGYYLGPEFAGERLDRYILQVPVARLPVYHTVGALDPMGAADVRQRVDDGLPETLPEWIRFNGLTHFKIKLNGDDMGWDVERVLGVGRVAEETGAGRHAGPWVLSLDFNERCANVGYLLDFLHRVKEKSALVYDRLQYIEQPTARDLEAHPENVMHEAAKLKPVVIDESLTGLDRLLLARRMGYTGVALKACKGQSQSLLLAAAGQKYKMFLCVQDLTCPGAALIESAALAAHVPGVAAIEANARQFIPAANAGWEKKFPGIFHITDGTMDTRALNGPGLGAG